MDGTSLTKVELVDIQYVLPLRSPERDGDSMIATMPELDNRPDVMYLLALTGVPVVQLANRATNGRWDEVYRSLVALKQIHGQRVVAIILLEKVKDRVHLGVAALIIEQDRLAKLHATNETEALLLFAEWARQATVHEDCCTSLVDAVTSLYPKCPPRVAINVYVSPDDDIALCIDSAVHVPSAASEQYDLVVKVFGGPCGWAQKIEVQRIPLLVASLRQYFSGIGDNCCDIGGVDNNKNDTDDIVKNDDNIDNNDKNSESNDNHINKNDNPIGDDISKDNNNNNNDNNVHVRLVHLGSTRLRLSQCVLCPHGAISSTTKTRIKKIPRVSFHLNLGKLTNIRDAAEIAHHFIVETMWTEQRRNTPRHHVTLHWYTSDGCIGDQDRRNNNNNDIVRSSNSKNSCTHSNTIDDTSNDSSINTKKKNNNSSDDNVGNSNSTNNSTNSNTINDNSNRIINAKKMMKSNNNNINSNSFDTNAKTIKDSNNSNTNNNTDHDDNDDLHSGSMVEWHSGTISALQVEAIRADKELRAQRVEDNGGVKENGPCMASFVHIWEKVLMKDCQNANRSIKLLVNAKCDTIDSLEYFTACVVQWQLQWLH